jgi:hypothetical protein
MGISRWPLLLGCAALLAAGARAQNLLVNPNFDTDVSGWNTFQGMVFDSTRDSAGNPLHGSGQQPSQGAFCSQATQCLNITPGVTYSLTGQLLFPSGNGLNTGPGTADIFMGFYDATCGSQSLSLVGAPPISSVSNNSPAESWLVAPGQVFTAPLNALSVNIGLEVCQQQPQTNVTANFDNLVFQQVAAPIPTLGRTAELLLAGLLAAVGILAARWRAQ